MRVVVVGATGNVGTSVLEALGHDEGVDQIVGVARRVPSTAYPKTTWRQANVTSSDLVPLFEGADVVIHLAWSIQPSHDIETLLRTNVFGSQRVLDAVAAAAVPALVVASSVGALKSKCDLAFRCCRNGRWPLVFPALGTTRTPRFTCVGPVPAREGPEENWCRSPH